MFSRGTRFLGHPFAWLFGCAALLVAVSAVAWAAEPIVTKGGAPAAPEAAVPPPDAEVEATAYKRAVLDRATTFARDGNRPAAAAVLAEVRQKLGPTDPFPDELAGTAEVLEKDYPAAEASFRAMLVKAPESHVARFNLAETLFLQSRYELAEHSFASLETSRRAGDPAVADLCRFKRVVCLLALGALDRAEGLLPVSETTLSSPAVQYSRAALRFVRKDRRGAAEILEAARKQFSQDVTNLYLDSFIELHWGALDDSGKFVFLPSK